MSLTSVMFLDPEKLRNFVELYREVYSQAKPFPHIVIDNFLSEQVLEKVLYEFPKLGEVNWYTFDRAPERKRQVFTSPNHLGEITRLLLYQLNSSVFIDFVEELTGINRIIPDPHFKGAGTVQTERGGYMKIHADVNKYQKLNLDRRLVFLLYLNKNWEEEYGGHLELWNTDMTECVQRILPIFNRCVIFTTNDLSYHGHPDPLKCPKGQTRKSIAVYYYTNGRPIEEVSPAHSTLFQERPSERIPRLDLTPKVLLKKLVPPIFIDMKNSLQPNKPPQQLKKH